MRFLLKSRAPIIGLLIACAAAISATKPYPVAAQQGEDEFNRGTSTTSTEVSRVKVITREYIALQDEKKKKETTPERKVEIVKREEPRLIKEVDEIDAANTGETADPILKQEAAGFALQTGDLPKATKRSDEAVALAEKTKDPATIVSALKTRALTHGAAGDNEKANADAKRVLEINPKDEEAQIIDKLTSRHVREKKLDMTHREGGAPSQELQQLITAVREKAPQTRPEGFGASVGYTNQASNAMKLGDWEAVKQKATLALEKLPKNPKARLERATANIKLGLADEAIADATAGLLDKPNSPALLSVRAAAYNEKGDHKAALGDANKALEINPKHAFSYLQKGLAREKMGEPDDQYLADFKTAAELDPDLEEEYAAALTRRREGGGRGDANSAGQLSKQTAVKIGGAVFGAGVLALLLFVFGRRKKESAFKGPLGPGSIVGGSFKLGPVIGTGGMGHVYEAWDTNLERPVAIKRLSEKLRDDPEEAEALIREAKTVAALKHPNIVAIYDAFKEQGEVYLVFELVKGETLYDYVMRKGGKLDRDTALKILGPVSSALDYAHDRRVIHRDLKPTNVMLEDGHVKVMDFGIARRMKSDGVLTMTSRVVGTPPFMAPEQQFGEVSRESDLYALAICAYHMMAGVLPFDGDTAHAKKLEGRFTPIKTHLPNVSPAVDEVFARAFAPDRLKRFHSGSEFFNALREALG